MAKVTNRVLTTQQDIAKLNDAIALPPVAHLERPKNDESQSKNSEENVNELIESEDDEGVVTHRKPTITTNSSPLRDPLPEVTKNNPVVSAFIRERKNYDPAWTQAAESVFSTSHPFKNKKRNRSHEEPKTQAKEHISSRSSSESRCSSPKKRSSICKINFTIELSPPKQDEEIRIEPKVKRTRQKRKSPSACLRQKAHEAKAAVPSLNMLNTNSTNVQSAKSSEGKESKSDSSKSSEDQRPSFKKKRPSMSMPRQRPSSYINGERLLYLKHRVDTAIREHKVYSMTGHYNSVRRALRQRGWVEKIDSDLKGRKRLNRTEDSDEMSLQVSGKGENTEKESGDGHAEAEIINRMLRNIPEDLCWLSKPYPYCWKDMNKCDMVNRLPKAYFSNKVGLCNSLAHMQWYYEPGICTTQYPRTYNMSLRDEYDSFKEDFRLTSCVSALKWLTTNYKQGGETAVRSPEGRVDVSIIEFALRRCAEFVKYKEHEDIDILDMPPTWEHQWDHFLTQYYKIMNEGNLLREVKEDPPVLVIVSNAQTMINLMRPYWPQMDIEGCHNFWIVKPGGRCCGNGIVIRSNLEQIMAIVNPSITRETRYVVQKYIEKPLLIYNTKFDIRQWFLVTNVYPLTIWMYKESYLRFCSTAFTLKSTHEAIHLCNNAVQRRYKNGKRDRSLPDENMWDCYTFQTYLKAIGHPTAWEDVIYPGMKESFVGALLASQDNMERRRNCFELYGADFMISEQITDGPWLIEINSNPAMDSSTSVTARMCPQVLEDIVKVIIDRRTDKNAPTGAFEMVFKQNCPPIPPYLGMSLCIRGKKIYKAVDAKHFRKARHNRRYDYYESSDSSEDENVVQRRCSTDFMQPIKTLRDEIQRLGVNIAKDELLTVSMREEPLSDSAANDTDTSRGSNSDCRIALEGKEIELKRKKSRKRRHKGPQLLDNLYRYRVESAKSEGSRKDDEMSFRKKLPDKRTDWVRRNIESVRSANATRMFEKGNSPDEEDIKYLSRRQENLGIYKDYILSGQCFEEYKANSNNKNSNDVLENLFREEMSKIINASEATEFRVPVPSKLLTPNIFKQPENDNRLVVLEAKESIVEEESILKPLQGPVIITGLWEPVQGSETRRKLDSHKVNQFPEVLRHDQDVRSNGPSRATSYSSINLGSENFSMSNGDLTELDTVDSGKSSSRSCDQCEPTEDFDTKFENELLNLEGKDEKSKSQKLPKDFTQALNITAPDLVFKERSKNTKWQNSKTSMEYFREWKYKINETRKNCEDMLLKLRHFKETNSKIKFQYVLQRRIEEEARLIRKMKQYKMDKNNWGTNAASSKPEDRIELPSGKETRQKPVGLSLPKRDSVIKIYTSSNAYKENRYANYFYSSEDLPLAISSQSGAVRNVNEVLPKIKLRNRPLLPNASSGHCRNVNK